MLDALKYKRSRYFNLEWFAFNHSYANSKLDFGYQVKELLDPTKCRITVSDLGDRRLFKFWEVKNGKLGKVTRKIYVMNNNNVLKIKKRKCIEDAHVYAIGIKLKFLRWPKKWRTLKRLCDTVFIRKHIEKGEVMIEFRDIFYNRIKKDPVELVLVGDFCRDFLKYRNLLQYKNKELQLITDLQKKHFGNR